MAAIAPNSSTPFSHSSGTCRIGNSPATPANAAPPMPPARSAAIVEPTKTNDAASSVQ